MRAILIIAMTAGVASACPQTGYIVRAGSLSTGPHCGEYIIATSPSGPDRATGNVTIKREVNGNFELSFKWRALTAQAVTLQLRVPGGYLLMRDGQIGFYTTEAEWAQRGYGRMPVEHITSTVSLRVRRRGDMVTAFMGDSVVGNWVVLPRPVTDIEIGLIGPETERVRMWVGDIAFSQ